MELEGDVDIADFGPEIVRRQQVQSYFHKVLVQGLDDATKIQYYHRYVIVSLPRSHQVNEGGGCNFFAGRFSPFSFLSQLPFSLCDDLSSLL